MSPLTCPNVSSWRAIRPDPGEYASVRSRDDHHQGATRERGLVRPAGGRRGTADGCRPGSGAERSRSGAAADRVRTERAAHRTTAECLADRAGPAVQPDEHHAADRVSPASSSARSRRGGGTGAGHVQRRGGLQAGAEGTGQRGGTRAASGAPRAGPAVRRVQEIESTRLVPGDVVLVEAGDVVPADGRIVLSTTLEVQEAALTGESAPVSKDRGPCPSGTSRSGTAPTWSSRTRRSPAAPRRSW